jgi:hypothetical protein
VRWSVEVGAKKLGSLDLFDATSKLFGLDPWKPGDIGATLFAKLDDPRALPLVTAAWTTAAASKKVRSAKSNDQYLWTVWRHAAIRLFASQGRTDDITFLREQAAATRDRGVKRAIGKAIAAIEKRAAKP